MVDDFHNSTIGALGQRWKVRLSPRVGLSFPVTEKDKFFFNYGHFSQWPRFAYVYPQLQAQTATKVQLLGNPNLDPKTRTLKVRMRFDNPDEVLKPNMLAEVVIYGEYRSDVLAIPREALIETGKHQRVILALGEGRFEPRPVLAGMESDGWVEITGGPGGTSAIFTRALYRSAMALSGGRTRLAMSWLWSSRSPLCTRFT